MKCHICNRDLTDKEVVYNDEMKAYEPCTVCLDIALEAAYSDGFLTEDDEFVIINDEGDAGDMYTRYSGDDAGIVDYD